VPLICGCEGRAKRVKEPLHSRAAATFEENRAMRRNQARGVRCETLGETLRCEYVASESSRSRRINKRRSKRANRHKRVTRVKARGRGLADFLMQCARLCAEFSHFAENRRAARRPNRELGKRRERRDHCVWVGVVGVVEHHPPSDLKSLKAHVRRRDLRKTGANRLIGYPHLRGSRDGRKCIQRVVLAGHCNRVALVSAGPMIGLLLRERARNRHFELLSPFKRTSVGSNRRPSTDQSVVTMRAHAKPHDPLGRAVLRNERFDGFEKKYTLMNFSANMRVVGWLNLAKMGYQDASMSGLFSMSVISKLLESRGVLTVKVADAVAS
jgi:hypothetical protein